MEQKIIDRFWANVEKTDTRFGYENYGCWIWKGAVYKDSPVMSVKRNTCSARRISIEISGKTLSPRDLVYLNGCKNNLCVNPNHLVFGDEARFYSKVYKFAEEKGGCWEWIGYKNPTWYGQFACKLNGKKKVVLSHHYSWYLYTGFMPKALIICHKCDHPYCVNPDHLFLGTHADNVNDKVSKGRQTRGETNASAKLTDEKVREARELYKNGMKDKQLSLLFGVHESTMRSITRNETWRHLL
jgi:hypothetical protein